MKNMYQKHSKIVTYMVLFLLTANFLLSLAGCGDAREETKPSEQEKSTQIQNANEKYPNANDEMVYFVTEEGKLEQWSFDGVYQKIYTLEEDGLDQDDLLYVNNSEILWRSWPEDNAYPTVMRTPIEKTESGQELKTADTEKLFVLEEDIAEGGSVCNPGTIFANPDYVVYASQYPYGGKLYIYDRKRKKRISKGNSCLFSQYALSAASEVCGNQIIFNTYINDKNPAENKYGLSLYRFGEKQTRVIDSRSFLQAAFIADSARNKVYYQIWDDQGIWEYDCQTERKREMISEEVLQACYASNNLVWDEAYYDDSLFVDGSRLYFVKNQKDPLIFSCDLSSPAQSFSFERELTQVIQNQTKYDKNDSSMQRLAILEGKLILYWEDYEYDEYYACIDIKTIAGKLVGKRGWLFQIRDPEMIYFALFGAWEEPGTTGKLKEITNTEKITSDQSPETVQNLSYQEQLQLFGSQSEQWMGTDSEDMPYQYYAVTDLDQNGKLELIASSGMQGSGYYTYSDFYQIAADGISLRKCITEWAEGDSQGDIVDGIYEAYVDPDTGNYYYIASDYVSGGFDSKYCWNGAIVLKKGMITTRTFGSMEGSWNKKKKKLQFHYYKRNDGEGKEISKKEYNPQKLAEEYFKGFEKKSVNISWVRFQKKRKKLTEDDIIKKLTKSYEAFKLT